MATGIVAPKSTVFKVADLDKQKQKIVSTGYAWDLYLELIQLQVTGEGKLVEFKSNGTGVQCVKRIAQWAWANDKLITEHDKAHQSDSRYVWLRQPTPEEFEEYVEKYT